MSLGMPDGVDSREDASLLNRNVVGYGCVFYGWRNSKAMAEGRKCNGYLCYRAGLRAGEVAGWACTIAITCSEFHKRHEKSRRLGWVASTDGPFSMCGRACVACGRAIGV